MYPNAGRALLEAGAGIIIFGDTAASKLMMDAVARGAKTISEERGETTPGNRVDAAIETLENALEDVVRLAASGDGDEEEEKKKQKKDSSSPPTPKNRLIEAAKLLFCKFYR